MQRMGIKITIEIFLRNFIYCRLHDIQSANLKQHWNWELITSSTYVFLFLLLQIFYCLTIIFQHQKDKLILRLPLIIFQPHIVLVFTKSEISYYYSIYLILMSKFIQGNKQIFRISIFVYCNITYCESLKVFIKFYLFID